MKFDFNFSGRNPENAASTHVRMDAIIDQLINRGFITPYKSTMYKVTDGCSKQYSCSNALMLLTLLAESIILLQTENLMHLGMIRVF